MNKFFKKIKNILIKIGSIILFIFGIFGFIQLLLNKSKKINLNTNKDKEIKKVKQNMDEVNKQIDEDFERIDKVKNEYDTILKDKKERDKKAKKYIPDL